MTEISIAILCLSILLCVIAIGLVRTSNKVIEILDRLDKLEDK